MPVLAAALDRVVGEHAVVHGWSKTLRAMVCRGIHALLAVQDTPGSPIRTSELAVLSQLPNTTIQPVLEVLSAAGMLEDDRAPALEEWFERRTAGLAEPMRSEVRLWFCALRDGSTVAPRTRPRSIETVRHRVITVTDVLHAWSGLAIIRFARSVVRTSSLRCRTIPTAPPSAQPLRLLEGRLVFTNDGQEADPCRPSRPMVVALSVSRRAAYLGQDGRACMSPVVRRRPSSSRSRSTQDRRAGAPSTTASPLRRPARCRTTRKAAAALNRGISMRDAAAILGISHQRVHQLLMTASRHAAKPADNNSRFAESVRARPSWPFCPSVLERSMLRNS